jgi:hypothetical protein
MLDANRSALTDESRAVGYGTGGFAGPSGSRSSRKKKRGLFRRAGILPPAIVMAALLVAVVYFAAQLMSPNKTGAASMYGAIDGLGHGGAAAQLVAERQNIIDMSAAAKTLSVAAKPATVDPAAMTAAAGGGGTANTGGGTTVGTVAPPANPTAAEQDGKALLPSFGFDQGQSWTCLYNLWMRESGWNVYAENASGAYGIPQSLPGDKMASVASDWQTNPITQIKWGLGYIKSIYGTPCGAWDHEVADGWY